MEHPVDSDVVRVPLAPLEDPQPHLVTFVKVQRLKHCDGAAGMEPGFQRCVQYLGGGYSYSFRSQRIQRLRQELRQATRPARGPGIGD